MPPEPAQPAARTPAAAPPASEQPPVASLPVAPALLPDADHPHASTVPTAATSLGKRSLQYRHHPSFFRSSYASDEARLQQRVDALAPADQTAVRAVWSMIQDVEPHVRELVLDGILHRSPLSQLSYISNALAPLTRVDFIGSLPTEISFQILRYLDGKSLCHSAQVSRKWRAVADDDAIWHRMCTQHIDKKCTKCGWGLPLMHTAVKRPAPVEPAAASTASAAGEASSPAAALAAGSASDSDPGQAVTPSDGALATSDGPSEAAEDPRGPPRKRLCAGARDSATSGPSAPVTPAMATDVAPSSPSLAPCAPAPQPAPQPASLPEVPRRRYRRPWKEVYAERLIVERNWRNAKYTALDLKGHKDGIMTLWYDDCKSLLVTGGFDHTLRAWNVQTGECLAVMSGHTRCVRGVQFDDSKIISCSMDRTLRIWSMRDFTCLRTIVGHNDGVVCLHFTDKVLASGSVDGVTRVTNLAANKTSSLNGHTDWVNRVLILPCKARLLSCSDDATMRLWDIESRETLRVFSGHVAPVQSLQVIMPRSAGDDVDEDEIKIVTGSLDHTVKIWNFRTAHTERTLFGHVEGVWCVDVDTLRIVSASHDRTLKVWDIESGKCMYTIDGHAGSVNCCRLSDTKLISGDETGLVTVRNFLHNT
ncbi:hypothetical protein HK105_207496 [Polyrhizophydium stewartii]|uniref:F-box domain-containing protein n=1 Tax=Polyrhizophydium stewartii TaxID=2732419 RepID=A0ABR4N0I7_9FUNG